MADEPDVPAATMTQPVEPAEPRPEERELALDDLLVEDVSIDGMCGVY